MNSPLLAEKRTFEFRKMARLLIYLWSAWCWIALSLVLGLAFPLLLICILLKSKKSILFAISMQRGVARISNFLFGIRFVQIGKTKPNFNKQYIYISNHNSNLDPFISGALIESDYKFIGKAEALKIPVIGYALRHLNVPVERANPEDRARSMADLAHALKQGFSLIIYPEGTRNRGNELVGAFWEGAFRLSIEYGFSIVILAAINSDQRIPPTRWLLNPGKLFYAWSEPIHPAPNEEKEAFSNRCKTIMMDMLRSEINQLKRKK